MLINSIILLIAYICIRIVLKTAHFKVKNKQIKRRKILLALKWPGFDYTTFFLVDDWEAVTIVI